MERYFACATNAGRRVAVSKQIACENCGCFPMFCAVSQGGFWCRLTHQSIDSKQYCNVAAKCKDYHDVTLLLEEVKRQSAQRWDETTGNLFAEFCQQNPIFVRQEAEKFVVEQKIREFTIQ